MGHWEYNEGTPRTRSMFAVRPCAARDSRSEGSVAIAICSCAIVNQLCKAEVVQSSADWTRREQHKGAVRLFEHLEVI